MVEGVEAGQCWGQSIFRRQEREHPNAGWVNAFRPHALDFWVTVGISGHSFCLEILASLFLWEPLVSFHLPGGCFLLSFPAEWPCHMVKGGCVLFSSMGVTHIVGVINCDFNIMTFWLMAVKVFFRSHKGTVWPKSPPVWPLRRQHVPWQPP